MKSILAQTECILADNWGYGEQADFSLEFARK